MKKRLKEFLLYRILYHKSDFVFWMYLIFIICGIGASGIWIQVAFFIKNGDLPQNIANAVYTFFPPIIVSSCSELLLSEKTIKPIRMLGIVLIIGSLVWMLLCANLTAFLGICFGTLGCVIAVFTWIVAHGEDPIYTDFPDESSLPIGGDVSNQVTGNEGEFKL